MPLINKHHSQDYSGQHIIVSEYLILMYYDKPILFTGMNKYNSRVIGSLLWEDDASGKDYHLYTLATDEQYSQFVQKEISYRNILDDSTAIYLTEAWSSMDTQKVFAIKLIDLEADILPTYASYLYKPLISKSNKYSLSFMGGVDTARNRIKAKIAQGIIPQVASIFQGFKPMFDFINQTIETNLLVSTQGSYVLNFEIELPTVTRNMFVSDENMNVTIHEQLDYLLNGLMKEYKDLYSDQEEMPPQFAKTFNSALEKLSIPENLQELAKIKMKEQFSLVSKNVAQIAEILTENNLQIKIESEGRQIAEISSDNRQSYSELYDNIIELKDDIIKEEEYSERLIHIYSLNKNTRIGSANIFRDKDKTSMWTPKIVIEGDETLTETKYTSSFHHDTWIMVQAKATIRVKDKKILKLIIKPE